MNELAPIVLFTYNRPLHTKRVLDALVTNKEAKDSILYVYCDGPKSEASPDELYSINETRRVVTSEDRFKEIVIKEQVRNKGLAKSIIDGVTEVISKHGKIIVVEDDIVTSPYFLSFMNEGLEKYKNESRVACLNGYVYPVKGILPETFFIKGADCWGWATWKHAWDIFKPDGKKLLKEIEERKLEKDFDFGNTYPYIQMLKDQISGKNNSWAIRWYASAYLENKLCLYPGVSLVQNIGIDGSGINSGESTMLNVNVSQHKIELNDVSIEENIMAKEQFAGYFIRWKRNQNSVLKRIKNKIKNIFNL